ncbi:AzlD family protein [Rhizobium halophytocola]|uniref:Membrane protein n=1 Tax=Rhizobium halophytocola TaxID=735519 RepID=A0ABS4E322_9HYPH|nr:AzlD domain-containing protein [Rhizobium halophytocola]MBP1852304.1 putative membrane protein [Rhizobium halophytocola]
MSLFSSSHMVIVILLAGLATYLTRIGGHAVISRMKTVPPRLEAALDAVPAAVLTTLVVPAFANGGWDTRVAMLAALLVGLRFAAIPALVAGWAVVLALRTFAV